MSYQIISGGAPVRSEMRDCPNAEPMGSFAVGLFTAVDACFVCLGGIGQRQRFGRDLAVELTQHFIGLATVQLGRGWAEPTQEH